MRLLRQCLNRFIGECAAFEKAITHVVVKVGPLFSIVAYDVPDVLLGQFRNVRGPGIITSATGALLLDVVTLVDDAHVCGLRGLYGSRISVTQAGPLISSDEPPDDDPDSAEHSFASTLRRSQMGALIAVEEEDADGPRRRAAEYSPYLEHRERRLSGSDLRIRKSGSRRSGEQRRSKSWSRKQRDPDDGSDSDEEDRSSVVRDKDRSRLSSSDDESYRRGSRRRSEEVDWGSSREKVSTGSTTPPLVLTGEGGARSPMPSSPTLNPMHERELRASEQDWRGSDETATRWSGGGNGAVSTEHRRRRRRHSSLGERLPRTSLHSDDSEVSCVKIPL